MCIICAKPAGIDMPSDKTIRNMWDNNKDGAGIMYAKDGMVNISKGYMKFEDFEKALNKLKKQINLKDTPIVMHFRITTHGGTKPENCHPFPISDSIGMLKKLKQQCAVGVAHNGIIDVTPRSKDISDTMEYIISQLSPLYKGVPKFYKNKNLMRMIENAIDSKMALLTGNGELYTIGKFYEENGIMYSNQNYKPYKGFYQSSYGMYYKDCWEIEHDEWSYVEVEWLDETDGEYIKDEDGDMFVGDIAIDKNGRVYEMDWDTGELEEMKGMTACTSDGKTKIFNPNSAMTTYEIIRRSV